MTERLAEKWGAALPRVAGVLLAGLAALAAVAAIGQVGEITARKAAAAVLLVTIFGIAYVTRRAKEIFLFGFIFALTYNRQYFVLQGLFGHPGTQGPYVIPADIFFLALLGLWLHERVVLKRRSAPLGPALWPWYLPYALACVFSLFVATHLDWAVFELIRVTKVGLILWYVRYNLGPKAWWISLAALGAALSIQSVLGILEVAFRRSGVLWIFGLSSQQEIIPRALEAESFYGWTRAQATMNHPPNLACYLLLTVPVFVALALSYPERSRRALCALVALLGLTGLACTLSRWPIVLMAVLLVLLLLGLTGLRVISAKQSIAMIAVGVLIVSVAGVALADFIADRMTRDFQASVDQRLEGFKAALHMYEDGNPLLGVGLNNYRSHMLKYEPDMVWIDEYENLALDMNVRFPAAPQNAFLLVLAETGVVGLAGFAVYVLGALYVAAGGIAAARGHYRAAAFGLFVGFAGVMLQQSIDHSYWVDPILYSTALVIALMNNVKTLSENEVKR